MSEGGWGIYQTTPTIAAQRGLPPCLPGNNPLLAENLNKKAMVNKSYRVDLVLVPVNDTKALTDVQSKLNQWITKQELVKFDVLAVGDNSLLFKICRLKGKE